MADEEKTKKENPEADVVDGDVVDTEEDFLKSMDDEMADLEAMLKSADNEVNNELHDILKSAGKSEEEISELLEKAKGEKKPESKGDDDDDDDDDDEDMYKGKNKKKKLAKSHDDDDFDDDGDEDDSFIDATPILEKSLAVQKSLKKENHELKARLEMLEERSDENNALVKSVAKVVINTQKLLKSMSGIPVGELKGTSLPDGKTISQLAKSKTDDGDDKYHGFTYHEAKKMLLKACKDKEVGRDAVMAFEQGGQMTQEAHDHLLLKSKE